MSDMLINYDLEKRLNNLKKSPFFSINEYKATAVLQALDQAY